MYTLKTNFACIDSIQIFVMFIDNIPFIIHVLVERSAAIVSHMYIPCTPLLLLFLLNKMMLSFNRVILNIQRYSL